jgi:hypothetical protein
MRPRVFLGLACATTFALAAVCAGAAILVDPYRYYGTAPVSGWTALKPRVYQEAQIAKTSQLARIAPRTLLLGNSRVEVGLDPESRYWPAGAAPVFNAAEAGRSLFTAQLMLREAIAVSQPKLVVVGLDFQDFQQRATPPTEDPPRDSEEDRLHVDRDGNPNPRRLSQVWRDRVATTLSLDALSDSLATLVDQNASTSVTMTPSGFNPLNDYRLFVARSGYGASFAQKNADYERSCRTAPRPDFRDPDQIASFRYLQQIIAIAAEHHIDVVLFIHPYHSDYLEMLHRLGLWDAFEDWKRAVVRVAYANPGAPVRLYDFADYNEVTTEPVPAQGDVRTAMQWYWEAGHYKSTLGDKVLATMFGGAGFGRLLTPDDVEADISDVRAHREAFRARLDRSR